MKTLTGVDVILGPLLTLIVSKSGKKSLKFDLSCIAIMQLAALGYGAYTVWTARPAFVVFAVDRFEVIQVNDAVVQMNALPEFQKANLFGPVLATIELPTGDKMTEIALAAANGGRDVAQYQEYYRDFASALSPIGLKAKPLSTLLGRDQNDDKVIANFIAQNGGDASTWRYLPLVARNIDYAAVIDSATGKPKFVLPIYPWTK